MIRNTVNTTGSVMSIDALFLRWTTSISPFGLIREVMTNRTVHFDSDRQDLVALVNQLLHDRGYDIGILIELTSPIEGIELQHEEQAPNFH